MPSKSRLIHLVGTALFVLALLPGLPTAAFAGEPSTGAEAAPEGTAVPEKTGADRVYVTKGATITWDLERKESQPPRAERAAELARRFREWMEASGEGALPTTEEIVVEELPGGVRRARLPIHLMNTAMARIDPQGGYAGMCTEGPAGAAEMLRTPAPVSGEVWR